jgi:hypothetical protein
VPGDDRPEGHGYPSGYRGFNGDLTGF